MAAAVARPRTPFRRWLGPLFLTRPSSDQVQEAIRLARGSVFDHPHVGATLTRMPEGWHQDEQSVVLGTSDACWSAARRALSQWAHFDLDWVWPHDRGVPIEEGRAFAFTSRQLGVWSVNVCRVAFVVDEKVDGVLRWGFGYGTVGSHVVRGEELFLLEREPSGVVRFTIRKFSRPAHPLVALALPLARSAQRRFSEDALARMAEEVA